jgi:4a-hydroxytetrahydrobiopterin dehydratase
MDARRLEEPALGRALARVPAWSRAAAGIERTFRFGGFPEAVSFVMRVAFLAEAANHHPDIDVRWDRVRVFLTTHTAKGLTEADVALAERVDHMAAGWARD